MTLQDPVPAYVLWFNATGLTLARSLGRRGVPVVAVHHDAEEPSTGCRYVRMKILPPLEKDERAWLDFLVDEGRKLAPRKAVLLVASDDHWLFVAKHRAVLEQYFAFSMPGPGDVSAWMTKPFQYAAAAAAGIPFPRTLNPFSLVDVERASSSLMFPCLIKPTMSHVWRRQFGSKLTLVQTREQLLEQSAKAFSLGLEFMIQEYIPADDHEVFGFYACLDRASKPLGWCVSRKLRQCEPRFGSSCYSMSVKEPEVERLGLRLLQSMGYHGIASVEFKRDPRDGTFKLMEINVRPPLLMATAQDSGVDLTYMAYCDLCGLPQPEPKRIRYGKRVGIFAHDIHSSRFYRQLGRLSLSSWLWSWVRARDTHFAWDDLAPMRGYCWMMLDQWKRGKYRTLPSNFPPPAVFDAVPNPLASSRMDDKVFSLIDSPVSGVDARKPVQPAVTAAADR